MQPLSMLVALLFVLCASSGLALSDHTCIHDWIASATGKVPIVAMPSKATTEAEGESNDEPNKGFAPIRIKVVFTNASCEKPGLIPRPKSKAIARFYKRVCKPTFLFTPEKRALLLDKIIPSAVKLHQERLLVKPVDRITVPNFAHGLCAEFTVPADHRSTGVDDADMVLYLSVLPTFEPKAVWAFTCATQDGRPTVGVMNVGPETIVDSPQSVRVAAHAMAHALGFTNDNMAEKNMVMEKKNVRGKESVRMVKGATTVNATRKHYNCDTAEGMELEDEIITRLIPSHWERRNAKDELMAAITTAGYYTALTMAAFSDMGYYRANWSMAETMPWGNRSGCNLLNKPCVSEDKTEYPNMFCTVKMQPDCTSDRLAIGRCVIVKYLEPVPKPFRYFESTLTSGDSWYLMDYCPTITQYDTSGCTDGVAETIPGSVVGPDARCLRGQQLTFGGKPVSAVCANVSCKDNKVHVRLRGETTWRECPKDTALSITANDFSGSVTCPPYEEVCTVRSATPQVHDEKVETTVVTEKKTVHTQTDQATATATTNAVSATDTTVHAVTPPDQRSETSQSSNPTTSAQMHPKGTSQGSERLQRWT